MNEQRRTIARVAAMLAAIAVTATVAYRAGKRAAPVISPPAAPSPEEPHRDEHEHEGIPKRVRLPASVLAAANIRAEPARKELLRALVDLPGEVASNPDRTARVASAVAGRIEEVAFQEGSVVKKGDPLIVLRVPELARIRAAHAGTIAKARAARAEAKRLAELEAEGIVAKQKALDAEAQAVALEAEAAALGDQLGAMGGASGAVRLTIRAPLAGTVLRRNAVVGQPITADEAIGSIADLSEVWFIARIFEHDLHQVGVGAPAEIELNAHPTAHFAGKVDLVGFQIDPVARTLTARIVVPNPDAKLRVGLFGIARVATIDTAGKPPVLVVPRSAITQIGGKNVVFVRHPDDDFEVHELVVGAAGLGKVEVLAGLREGEQVVVDGVFTLKSAVLKSTFAEDE